MRSRLKLFLLIVALLASHLPGAKGAEAVDAPEKSAQEIMATARESVVVIRQSGRDGTREGIGTGFVISSDGLIATSLHVIGEARPLTVSLANGKNVAVTEVHAWDRKLDLAVIRVDAEGLKRLRLADSDNLKAGTAVVAIGNPHGLTRSIVQGVVSAIREFEFGPMIQLAIPIEPGNSGGPLLDMKGKVQGILEMKSAVTDNLGFATPINALKGLIEHPNSVPFEKWLAIGALNERLWMPLMGAQWRQKIGMITVEGAGAGFGGRSLCLSRREVPEAPYEIAVSVRLDDESGAAGLAFGSNGGDEHYGFYPSAGQLRLTRFDGPSVFTWNILRQIDTPHYRPGEWNRLKVRIEPERMVCFVNGAAVAEVEERMAIELQKGKAGLAKFRNTAAQFKDFQIGKSVDAVDGRDGLTGPDKAVMARLEPLIKTGAQLSQLPQLPEEFLKKTGAARLTLLEMARDWEQNAASARQLASEFNQRSIEAELGAIFQKPEAEADLFAAAFQVGRLENPDLNLGAYQEAIESMVEEIEKRLGEGEARGNRARLNLLRRYLFEENGFHGSRNDYYNRANSFMNRVLEDREGIPITLSVLFLEMGERLGISKLEGMPFPGHFMVRFTDGTEEPVYVDVFDGGKLYEKNQLYDLIANHSEVPLLEEHFKPATKKEIVVRILKNLTGSRQETGSRALQYLDLLLAIAPEEPFEHWRRASLRLQAGDKTRAREDLEWLLEKRPPGFDLERVDELYRSLKE